MKITLTEYRVTYNLPGFAESTEKYTTAPSDQDARNILHFMVNKADSDSDVISIEKYCPYSETWSLVADED